jgi:hypothetical protein
MVHGFLSRPAGEEAEDSRAQTRCWPYPADQALTTWARPRLGNAVRN